MAAEGAPQQEPEKDELLELGPDDPDYDLSETAGYAGWEPRRSFAWPQWLVITFSILLLLAFLLPFLLRSI